MRGADLASLVALGALWGSSFLFIRVAAPALGPVVLAEARVLLAAAALAAYALATGRWPRFRGRWFDYARLGAINAAVPFALVSAAALTLPASLLATLNAAIPLFTAAVAAIWLGERLTRRKVAGLLLGVAGVVTLVGWSPLAPNARLALAVGASLLAGACYAVGAVYARQRFAGVPPLELAIGQLTAAGILLLPGALATAPREMPAAQAVGATVALALLATAIAYLLFFRLIARVGPTKTNAVAFLNPGFGMLAGVVVLGERFTAGMAVGLAVIAAGVGLVTELSRGRGSRTVAGNAPAGEEGENRIVSG